MSDDKYNGWANYETWNVHLWLTNDELMYHRILGLFEGGNSYDGVVAILKFHRITTTGDGVRYDDPRIDGDAIREAFIE